MAETRSTGRVYCKQENRTVNIKYTTAAQAAYRAADAATRAAADSLLGVYSAYRNRHALPGTGTLKRLQAQARAVLGITGQVFEVQA